jgi:hypothetical protein
MGSALLVRSGREGVDGVLVRRGLGLGVLGLALNLATPSWFTVGSWFVLHLMGFALATTPLWRRLPLAGLLLVAGGVIVATPVLQAALGTPGVLSNARMADSTLPGGAARLALAEGQFPVFPWLFFYLVGFAVACEGLGAVAVRGRIAFGSVFGAALLVLALSRVVPAPPGTAWWRAGLLSLGFYPATAVVVLLLASAVLLVVLVALRLGTGLRSDGWVPALGRASLTLLLVHVPLFREATRPVGLWRALPASVVLAIIAGTIVLAALLVRRWQRVGLRYGAEWWLRRAAG